MSEVFFWQLLIAEKILSLGIIKATCTLERP